MDDLEEKIGSILSNPQMMQQLMSMAQTLGGQSQTKQEAPAMPVSGFPEIDVSMLQKFSGLARQGSIDTQQQALLKALAPYLSRERIAKLEKAMRAAKMAKIASFALGQRG